MQHQEATVDESWTARRHAMELWKLASLKPFFKSAALISLRSTFSERTSLVKLVQNCLARDRTALHQSLVMYAAQKADTAHHVFASHSMKTLAGA